MIFDSPFAVLPIKNHFSILTFQVDSLTFNALDINGILVLLYYIEPSDNHMHI